MMVEVSGESSTEPDKLTVLNDVAEENAKETLIEVEIGDETNHLEPPSVKKHGGESIDIASTKLRPEAPPFLPKRLMTLMKATPEDLMTDPTMIQNEVCYLTNVNLQCDQVANNEHEIDIQHLREPNKKDIGLKPFSLVSNVSRSTRKSQASEKENENDKEDTSALSGPLNSAESRTARNIIARYLQNNPKQVAVQIFIAFTLLIVLLALIILRLF